TGRCGRRSDGYGPRRHPLGRLIVISLASVRGQRPTRSTRRARAYRSGLELSPAAADLLRDLPPAVQRIPLGGLDSDSTNALVKGMWGVAPAAFVSEVHHRTNGNPFFVQEVTNLRLLQGERPGFAVPPGVSQVVGRRLARLSQAAHALLAA